MSDPIRETIDKLRAEGAFDEFFAARKLWDETWGRIDWHAIQTAFDRDSDD